MLVNLATNVNSGLVVCVCVCVCVVHSKQEPMLFTLQVGQQSSLFQFAMNHSPCALLQLTLGLYSLNKESDSCDAVLATVSSYVL
jgi:hypothetical protein